MKHLAYLLSSIMAFTPMAAVALDDDYLFPTDSRIKILPYDASDVYTIPTKYGYQTNIVFDPYEEIQTISVGDRSIWQIIPSGNRLFIRPLDENYETNMTIITSKRTYHFDLKSISADSKTNKIIYTAKFLYPENTPDIVEEPLYESPVAPVTAPPEPAASEPAAASGRANMASKARPVYLSQPNEPYTGPAPTTHNPGELSGTENLRYTYAGPDELAPLQVYDNGRSTFFKYRAMGQPLPNVYVVDKAGVEKPVAHYVKNGFMVVDDVTAEWLLKSSAGDVMVYNEMLNAR